MLKPLSIQGHLPLLHSQGIQVSESISIMRYRALIGMVAGLILFFPLMGRTEDAAILEVILNGENKGAFMAKIPSEGDFLFTAEDLKTIGFIKLSGPSSVIENQTSYSLKSIKGVTFVYDESRLVITISADPILLQKSEVDWSHKRQADIVFPKNGSFFINYGITQGFDSGVHVGAFSATQETGIRWGDYLLLSDSMYTHVEGIHKFTRLNTSITRDNRTALTRTVLGDVYTGSGLLGSDILIAGFSYFKNYSLEPSLWKQPTLDYAGFVSLPSQVDVYLDGVQIGSEKFSPGGFNLKNIPVSDGLHGMEIRVRDALGREQILKQPYYSSDILLRKGFHDFGYSVGVQRKSFGTESNRYDGLAFTAYHRYGLSSGATIGVRAEGGQSLINGGAQLSFRLGRLGTVDTSMALSAGPQQKNGIAANFNHSFLGKNFNFRFQASGYSERYSTLNTMDASDLKERPHFVLKSGISYRTRKLGSVSLDLTAGSKFSGEKNSSYGVTYARSLTKTMALTATYRQVTLSKKDNQVFVTLNFSPHKAVTLSTSYQRESNAGVGMVQLQKNPPTGTGLSYRMLMQKREDGGNSYTAVNPYIQYNGPFGIYSMNYRSKLGKSSENNSSLEVSASGSIVMASGVWGFSRPINDSFAIVRTSGLHGVRTYHNNHEIGTTDGAGKIVIPNLNAYGDNLVAINDKDIPVNYALKDVARDLSPAWRSGTLIRFEAVKTQAFSGKLIMKTENGERPLESIEMSIVNGNETLDFITARDGEFYLENISSGAHEVRFMKDQRPVVFVLKIPVSDAMMVDLGRVVVEKIH
jgi:outer membrane usher protein